MGAGAFWGSFFLLFYLGTGMSSLTFDFLFAWADRPKPMNESQFKKEKDILSRKVDYMLKEGKKIYDDRIKLDQ